MSIRKTGAATGRITEIEGAPGDYAGMGGVIKTAQQSPDMDPWNEGDEADLMAETDGPD